MGGVEGSEGMTLAIVGKSRIVAKSELDFYDSIWTVGTANIEADRYLCLHGEQSIHPDRDITWKNVQEIVTAYPTYPIVNSICVLLAFVAYNTQVMGVFLDRIDILASPLIAKKEMLEERSAVAFWVGYLRGKRITVNWEGGFKRALPYMWEEYGHKDFTGVIV